MKIKSGHKISGWSIVRRLDQGGNSTVWLAENVGGLQVALKVPKAQRAGSIGYQRFRDEVEATKRAQGHGGTLWLVDFSIPDQPSDADPAWLATELAIPMLKALAGASIEEALAAFSTLSGTLARLSREGIHHRDLKPSNLFYVDGEWVLGDFGLATYPDKAQLTTDERKLGPVYYIAPEMLNSPSTADPAPADVFSIAKSLWVMATGQTYPIPGPVRIDEAPTTVAAYVTDPLAARLDPLLQAATATEPEARPTMMRFAEELDALLTPVPRATGTSELPDLKDRIQSLVQPRLEMAQRAKAELEVVSRFVARGGGLLKSIAEELEASLGLEAHMSGSCSVGLFPSRGTAGDLYRNGNGYFVKDDAKPAVILEFGIGVHAVRDESEAYIGGAIAVRYEDDEYRIIWEGGGHAVLGAPRSEVILESLREGIEANMGRGVDVFVDLLKAREEGRIRRNEGLKYLSPDEGGGV